MSNEFEVTVYEFDGSFIAVCPAFPGITGQGASKEACIEDLTTEIEVYQNRHACIVTPVLPTGTRVTKNLTNPG